MRSFRQAARPSASDESLCESAPAHHRKDTYFPTAMPDIQRPTERRCNDFPARDPQRGPPRHAADSNSSAYDRFRTQLHPRPRYPGRTFRETFVSNTAGTRMQNIGRIPTLSGYASPIVATPPFSHRTHRPPERRRTFRQTRSNGINTIPRQPSPYIPDEKRERTFDPFPFRENDIRNYNFGPAATSALPASFPVNLAKFLMKRSARSLALASHCAASA